MSQAGTLNNGGGSSGTTVEKINVQTGTSPVVTSNNTITFNGAVVAAGNNPVRTDGTAPATMALEVQTAQAIASTDATTIGLASFNSADFTVDANGFVSSLASSGIETIDGDTGSVAGSTVTIETGGSVGTLNFSGSGTVLTLNVVDGSGNLAIGNSSASSGGDAIAIGTTNSQTGQFGISIGYNNIRANTGQNCVTIGYNSNDFGGINNTTVGPQANGGSGGYNTCLGWGAGFVNNTGESNVYIANNASAGSGETNVIRIGTQGTGNGEQNECYVAGITGVITSNSNFVTIDTTTGQLGAVSGGATGISTIDGDTGSVTGSTVTIETLPATNGGTAIFSGSATTMQFIASDSNNNVGFGSGCLSNITTGSSANTGLGLNALHAATTLIASTAIGTGALSSLVNGGNVNTAIGANTLSSLVGPGANSNTAIGQDAMQSATALSNSVCIGVVAGGSLLTGDNNTAVGGNSLQNCTSGTSNIAIGYTSASSYTGSESSNICIGAHGVASESNVTRIGFMGGSSSQTACYIDGIEGVTVSNTNLVTINTSTGQLGSQAVPASGITTIDGNTGSTSNSTVTFSGTLSGSTTKFSVSGSTLNFNPSDSSNNTLFGNGAGNGSVTGNHNTGIGSQALNGVSSGVNNTSLGFFSLGNVLTGSSNIGIGYIAGSNYASSESSNISIGNLGTLGESNVIRIGSQGSGSGQQSVTFIAGIEGATYSAGTPTPALTYCDTSDGQLVATRAVASSTATSGFGSLAVGTGLKNTANYAILVNVSMAITAATGATIVMGVGSTSTPTTNTIVASFSVAETVSFSAFVPAGYYMLVNTTGTIVVGSITTQSCAVG
jgi:hypothetical protein